MSSIVKRIIYWSVAFVLNASIFSGILFGRGNYSLSGFLDACFFPGLISIFVGLLIWCIYKGAFDIFVFGFGDLFSHMNTDPNKVHKYKDYNDYLVTKRAQRAYSRPIIYPFYIIGGAFLIASIVILIVFNHLS